jgi:hypothetical protein
MPRFLNNGAVSKDSMRQHTSAYFSIQLSRMHARSRRGRRLASIHRIGIFFSK